MDLQAITNNGSQLVMIPLEDLKSFGEQIAEKIFNKLSVEKEETFLTTKQAAKRLGVDVTTLYRWDKENYLKAARIGNKRRYKLSDIDRLLKVR